MMIGRIIHKLTLFLACGLLVWLATPTLAQEPDQVFSAVLTVERDRLFTQSLYGKRISSIVKSDLRKLDAEFTQIEETLSAEEQKLTQRRAKLPAKEFRELADAFDEKVQVIRREQDARVRALERKLDQQRAVYYRLAFPILIDLMKERGASMVIDHRFAFAIADGVNITDLALSRIDAALGDGVAEKP